MVDLLGYPYPHPRHIRPVDPHRRADWLAHIGATKPARRATDTLPAAPTGASPDPDREAFAAPGRQGHTTKDNPWT